VKNFFSTVLVFILLTQAAFADNCYTADQYRAEQAIRFHTNMMVVGLYCKAALQENTYAVYQNFTHRNQNVIQKQESVLISYFKKQGGAEKNFHTFRTDLANRASLQAGQGTMVFCHSLEQDYMRSKDMIPRDFQRWIEQVSLTEPQPSTQSLCGAARKRK